MTIAESMLPEFDQEMASTRRVLERIPEDKLDWTPHAKSFSMGHLATHVVNLLTWTTVTLENDRFDMMPEGAEPPKTVPLESVSATLELFDENLAAARAAIAAADDARMMSTWTLQANGEDVLTLPKTAVLRSFVMNHSIHHRAQLCVYLRLNDVPVPAIYGPSADEEPPM